MAWLERARDGDVEICVLETRGANLWERVARGKNRGRTRLASEHASAEEAHAAFAARVEQLTRDGFVMIDPNASVDARRPAGRAVARDDRLRADDLRRELRTRASALGEQPHCDDVLGAFAAVFALPRAYRTVSWQCTLWSARVSIVAHLPASEGHVREIGYELRLSSNAIADSGLVDGDIFFAEMGENLDQFAAAVRASSEWRVLGNFVCEDIDVIDEENG